MNPNNKRLRLRLRTATAILSLAVWLFMTVAEANTPLHAWLHGGSIPDDDDCALVAISHGKVETVAVAAPALVPVVWIEITPRIDFSIFHTATAFLPDGRAPPILPAVS